MLLLCYCSVMYHVKECMGRRTKIDPNPVEAPIPCGEGMDKFQESQYIVVNKSLPKMELFSEQSPLDKINKKYKTTLEAINGSVCLSIS